MGIYQVIFSRGVRLDVIDALGMTLEVGDGHGIKEVAGDLWKLHIVNSVSIGVDIRQPSRFHY